MPVLQSSVTTLAIALRLSFRRKNIRGGYIFCSRSYFVTFHFLFSLFYYVSLVFACHCAVIFGNHSNKYKVVQI